MEECKMNQCNISKIDEVLNRIVPMGFMLGCFFGLFIGELANNGFNFTMRCVAFFGFCYAVITSFEVFVYNGRGQIYVFSGISVCTMTVTAYSACAIAGIIGLLYAVIILNLCYCCVTHMSDVYSDKICC